MISHTDHTAREEVFDIVDHVDCVIGQAERKMVHASGLLHRSVHVLVNNSQGKILLQRRSHCKETFPDHWDSSASGHVGEGESYDQAAIRELEEELGIKISNPPEFRFKIKACQETGWEFTQVYQFNYDGPINICPVELQYVKWFTENEIATLLNEPDAKVTPSFEIIWSQLFSRGTLD